MLGNHPNRTPSLYTTARGVMSAASKSLRSWRRFRQLAIAALVGLSVVLAVPHGAYASAGPHYNVPDPRYQHASRTEQDPAWVQVKLSHRVWSGIKPGQGKEASTHSMVLATPLTASTAPSSYTLSLSSDVLYTGEPSDGSIQNFPGTGNTADDANHHYSDSLYYTWCGVGASDVALWFWPNPPNFTNSSKVYDPMVFNQYSSWNAEDIDNTYRLRGYMIRLADQTMAPTWSRAGMLSQSYYQSNEFGGVTLQVVQDALNWEASGENTSNWSNYFYTTVWNSSFYNQYYPNNLYQALHSDVVSDIYYSHVPVLVELTAGYLSNWPSTSTVNHMVAIVGYNDTQGTYTYIDTCKQYTYCNRYGQDTPDAHTVSQSQLAAGVANIGTNETTGDGGWVW